jgi:hypothetical protein
MKFYFPFFIYFICFFNGTGAQKLSIEISGGHNKTLPIVKGADVKNNSFEKSGLQPAYTVGVSGKIKNWLYVKSEIGYASVYSDLNISFKNKQGNIVELDEDYRSNNIYFGVLAEARGVYKFLYAYANLGVSSYSIVSGAFTSQSRTGSQFNPNDFNGTKFGIMQNTGIGFKVKSVGFFAGYGLNYIFPGKMKNELPSLGFFQINFRVGTSYDIE